MRHIIIKDFLDVFESDSTIHIYVESYNAISDYVTSGTAREILMNYKDLLLLDANIISIRIDGLGDIVIIGKLNY